MDLIDEVVDDPNCVFIFPTPEKLRPPLLKIVRWQSVGNNPCSTLTRHDAPQNIVCLAV